MNNRPLNFNWFTVFSLAICLLPLIAVWYYEYLPLQDYPNHFARIEIIKRYEHVEFYRDKFEIVFFKGILPLPYITLDLFASKIFGFIDTDKAMKIFISLYVIFYILSLYLLARHFKQDYRLLLLFNMPLMYSYFFNMGFLNFLFGIPIFLFSVYFIERYDVSRDRMHLLAAAIFALVIYLTHIFIFFIFCVFISCYLFWKKLNFKLSIQIGIGVLLFFVLTMSLGLFDFLTKDVQISLGEKFARYMFVFFHLPFNLLVINSILFLFAIYLIIRNSYIENKLYLLFAALCFLLFIALPGLKGITYVNVDIRALFFSIVLLPFAFRIKRAMEFVKFILIAVSIINFSYLLTSFSDFNKNFSTRCSGLVEDRSIVLPIVSTELNSWVAPHLFSWGYFYKDKEMLTPYLFADGHVPIKYKDEPLAPSRWWAVFGNKELAPELVNEIKDKYDYVILVGNDLKVEGLINSISYKECSEGIVSLYRMRKD